MLEGHALEGRDVGPVLGRGGHDDDVHGGADRLVDEVDVAGELLLAHAVGLGEDHRDLGAAVARDDRAAHDALEEDLARAERLDDEDRVDVGGERLLLAARAALPAGDVALTREDLAEQPHVVARRMARHDPVAHGDVGVVGALREGCGELAPRYALLAQNGGKAAVEPDHAGELDLGGVHPLLRGEAVALGLELGALGLAGRQLAGGGKVDEGRERRQGLGGPAGVAAPTLFA